MRQYKVSRRLVRHYDPYAAGYLADVRKMVQDVVREIARAAIADYTAKIVERELATPGGTKTGWRIIEGEPVHWRRAKRLQRKRRGTH